MSEMKNFILYIKKKGLHLVSDVMIQYGYDEKTGVLIN